MFENDTNFLDQHFLIDEDIINLIVDKSDIKKDDIVYTSNLYYVKEVIKVGTISKVIKDENNIADSFEISFFNNEIIPEEVLVIGDK